MAYFADGLIYGKPWNNEGWIQPLSIIDEWQQNYEEPQRFFWQFVRRGRAEDSPIETILTMAMTSKSGIRAATRREMIDDEAWYANPFFQQEPAKLRMDEFVTGVIADDAPYSDEEEGKLVQMLFFQRAENREPFSKRGALTIRVLLSELAKLQPQELAKTNDSAFMTLPPRLIQVLACLLDGSTVKETAKNLEISAHTVQEHVKRLYERSGTSNRAELAKFYRPFALGIQEMTLEDPLFHQRQLINEALRQPWPTLPGPD